MSKYKHLPLRGLGGCGCVNTSLRLLVSQLASLAGKRAIPHFSSSNLSNAAALVAILSGICVCTNAQAVVLQENASADRNNSRDQMKTNERPPQTIVSHMAGGASTSEAKDTGQRRIQWVRHVSAAYRERSQIIILMCVMVIILALFLYWQYLKDSMPLLVAAPMCLLTIVIGLLYDDQHRNIINEILAFICGMVVCGLFRLISQRKVLTACECRMCVSEFIVGKKLGEGNFGSVYKCKTSRKNALFGAGVTCVVKRIRVNLDTGSVRPHILVA